ncbi:MAG: extensin family protein [Rhodobacteraceae bacterium]|nr:extensin family protein [Paracoccaceae bacterium]
MNAVPEPGSVVVMPVVDGEPAPVCGEDGIIGQPSPKIEGPGDCGILEPVKVHRIAGTTLAPQPVIGCRAARALSVWLEEAAKPAFEEAGAALDGLDIAAAYVCRNVNYAEDGLVSQHAHGRAIDISRFHLEDGTTVSVLDGWHDEDDGPLLRGIHQAACGIFSTTLGPESDAYHADHFHYDVAERRQPYCP